MTDQFETADAIPHYDELAAERDEGNLGMRPEAAFAGQRDVDIGRGRECCGDLSPRRIELRTGSFDVTTEGAKAVGVDIRRRGDPQSQCPLQEGCDYPLLAVHRREDGVRADRKSTRLNSSH